MLFETVFLIGVFKYLSAKYNGEISFTHTHVGNYTSSDRCCHEACGCLLAVGHDGIYDQARQQVENAFYNGNDRTRYADLSELNDAITDRAHEMVCTIRRPCTCPFVVEARQVRRRFEAWQREGQGPRGLVWLEQMGMGVTTGVFACECRVRGGL